MTLLVGFFGIGFKLDREFDSKVDVVADPSILISGPSLGSVADEEDEASSAFFLRSCSASSGVIRGFASVPFCASVDGNQPVSLLR